MSIEAGIIGGIVEALAPVADPEVIAEAVNDYLEDHPEATCPIDDTAGEGDTGKVWSADKTWTETEELKEAITPLTPSATSGDVGKFLKAKTVSGGKVTEYEFGEGGGGGGGESDVEIKTSSASGVDLDITDAEGYVIMRLANGDIKTKNFDSGIDCTEFINPYHDVLFADDTKVKTTTHDHGGNQTVLDRLTAKNLGAIALSNYYPSAPWYPLSEHNMNPGTGVTEIPNAEHHNFTNNLSFHLNAVGSTFSSGKPSGQTPIGVNDTWEHGIIKMKRDLLYPDGGGVTINHPIWSNLTLQAITDMLDFDPVVLGIEIYNFDCEADDETGWALELWDNILKTGRRCWGFAVPDHYAEYEDGANWEGSITLFVPSNTQENCLKAIRDGAFYIQQKHTSLSLTDLVVNGHSVTVTASESATIKTVIDGEVADTTTGTTKTVNVPNGATYVRFEIATANDQIFTNPIMFKARKRFN